MFRPTDSDVGPDHGHGSLLPLRSTSDVVASSLSPCCHDLLLRRRSSLNAVSESALLADGAWFRPLPAPAPGRQPSGTSPTALGLSFSFEAPPSLLVSLAPVRGVAFGPERLAVGLIPDAPQIGQPGCALRGDPRGARPSRTRSGAVQAGAAVNMWFSAVGRRHDGASVRTGPRRSGNPARLDWSWCVWCLEQSYAGFSLPPVFQLCAARPGGWTRWPRVWNMPRRGAAGSQRDPNREHRVARGRRAPTSKFLERGTSSGSRRPSCLPNSSCSRCA